MYLKSLIFVLFATLSLPSQATPISISFEGDVFLPLGSGFLPTSFTPFSLLIEYDSTAPNLDNVNTNFAKYGPTAIYFTVGAETAFLLDGRLNIDTSPGFNGFQWVDDGAPWQGTLFGDTVDTLAVNFGRSFNLPSFSLDIVENVNLAEWEYTNGCFILSSSNGAETCFGITSVSVQHVPAPETGILFAIGLLGMMTRRGEKPS